MTIAQGLGPKTLFILILKRSAVLPIFIVSAILTAASGSVPGDSGSFLYTIGLWGMMLGAILFAGSLGVAWLEYIHYNILTDDDGIRSTNGIIAEEETGIPFRHIRQVKVRRSIGDQALGTSTLILTVLGDEDVHETEAVFPALDKDLATHLQNTILRKAQVEEMALSQNANS